MLLLLAGLQTERRPPPPHPIEAVLAAEGHGRADEPGAVGLGGHGLAEEALVRAAGLVHPAACRRGWGGLGQFCLFFLCVHVCMCGEVVGRVAVWVGGGGWKGLLWHMIH